MKLAFLTTFILIQLIAPRLFCLNSGVIDKIEPPFWWSGMEHTELQLLLYGSDIGQYEVRSSSTDIVLKQKHKADSPNYLFIDLDLEDVPPGHYPLELTYNSSVIGEFVYEIKERTETANELKGFDSSDVIYLITPDRFANGNLNNDEVPGMREGLNRAKPYGRHGGDLAGISQRLDYISDLGFTSIWLNPVLENDQEEWSYHGYATTDYYKVDPRFGTNEEYVKLSEKARSMGIKLIMDMVENHCGSEHWWMEDLPYKDWLNFQGQAYQNTNHHKSTLHDPYVSEVDRSIMTDGWFVPTMPDLNQRNPFMANYLIQNSIWWIEYARLGGIRQDTYSYPDRDFMNEWSCRIMSEYPKFNIVAEEWTENQATIAYWLENKFIHDGPKSCLPSAMDFPLNSILARAVTEEEKWRHGLHRIYECLANDFLYPDPSKMVIFSDNHDMSRIYTQVREDIHAFKRALTIVLTMRGIPQIYYGTEILMSNPGTDSHGVIRSDYPGGWNGDVKNAFTGAGMTEAESDAQRFVRKLVNWRKHKDVIHHGQLLHFIPENGVYVYFRYDNNDKIMIIINKNNDPVQLDLSRFEEMLGDVTNAKNILSDQVFKLKTSIQLPPKDPLVLELN